MNLDICTSDTDAFEGLGFWDSGSLYQYRTWNQVLSFSWGIAAFSGCGLAILCAFLNQLSAHTVRVCVM